MFLWHLCFFEKKNKFLIKAAFVSTLVFIKDLKNNLEKIKKISKIYMCRGLASLAMEKGD